MTDLEKIIFAIEAEIDSNLLEMLKEMKDQTKRPALPVTTIPSYGAPKPLNYQSHAELYSTKLNSIISILKEKTV